VTRRLEPVSGATAGALAIPLSALHHACFPEEPWDPRAMSEIMAISGFFGSIACEDGEPVGFALALDLGEVCEILALGVVPPRRRAETGTVLLASICDEARRRRAQRIFLEVAADNIAARALYAAAGFVQSSRRRNYYWRIEGPVDALVLCLSIADLPLST
jgi:[ribosomal protein S18]-alanine N-acetyltransferase